MASAKYEDRMDSSPTQQSFQAQTDAIRHRTDVVYDPEVFTTIICDVMFHRKSQFCRGMFCKLFKIKKLDSAVLHVHIKFRSTKLDGYFHHFL